MARRDGPFVRGLSRFVSAGHTRARGRVGERAARRWLADRGFEILRTNYRTKRGEIDVIARDDDCLCFIEIKARSTPAFGGALAAVPERKQKRIARAAGIFLAASGWAGPCRFDVLAIEQREGSWRFTLVKDAFWG